MKKKRVNREDTAALVRLLTESSVSLSHTDLALAKEQAAMARRLRLRFNIKEDPSLRRFTCRSCKTLIVPGVNARVRLGHGRPTIIRITCAECGHVNRKILSEP